MANIRNLWRSFSGGEITPEFGLIDDAKYQSGLARCRNFIVKPHGPVENRAGFAFVRETRQSNQKCRLIPFIYSTDQTMIVEMGAGYFRFHTHGGTLLTNEGVPYEIISPYPEEHLFDVHFVQSADVLTLVHPQHPPQELRRLGAVDWQLLPISLLPVINAPAAPTVVATGHTSVKYTYTYVVTAVHSSGSQSSASPESEVGGNLFETGGKVTISWSPVAGAERYRVFKMQGGLFGYIGQTTGLSIVDDNIAPDLSMTPPIYDDVFSTSGRITHVPVTAGGANYGSTSGQIKEVKLLNGGMFTGVITVSIIDLDGPGTGATVAITTETFGSIKKIKTITLTNPGHGYVTPSVKVTGGTIYQQPSFSISALPVRIELKVTDAGSGSGASFDVATVGGVITSVNVINGGTGYLNPVVTVEEGAGGSGALFGTPTVASEGDYPGAVSYYEQRRAFAGTPDKPQNIWMTRSGTEADMSYSLPIRDDDRISFRVAAREANTIRHIVPLSQLLLLTSSAEWRVTSVNDDAITPSSISVRPQSYVGASNVQPIIINNTLIYGAARGGHVRELAYNWQASGFITGDLSIRAPHLFDTFDIVDMAYAKAPQSMVWFVSTSGRLLGLTYLPEQQVGAWHWHDTDGVFESCAVVAEDGEDILYCVIRRTINGNSVRYIERMASRQFSDPADAFFVDCGATYSGVPADVISGLGHLEGKTVSILADGAVHPQRVVTDGSITLDVEASKIHIGLPIEADMQTLPFTVQLKDGSFGHGRAKNVNKVWLRVYRSSGIFVGPNASELTEAKQRTTEPYGAPPVLKSEEIPIMLTPSWAEGGQIFVRQSAPLPLTVVSMTAEVAVGG